MERVRLTNDRIEKLQCSRGKAQSFTWDTDVPRLAVRTTAAGVKSFVFESKLDRVTIRKTIGKCSVWTLSDARTEARRLQTLIDQGIDPRELEREKRVEKQQKKEAAKAAKEEAERAKDYTLRALLDTYANYTESQGKKAFAICVRSATKCHLIEADPELAEKCAKDVSSREIAALIRRVKEAGKERTAGSFRSYLLAAYNCARKAPVSPSLPSSFIDFNVESNPVDVVPTIPVKTRHRTLSKEELRDYIRALSNDSLIDRALILALYAGGQRLSQVLRATVSDYNTHEKVLRLLDPKGRRQEPREHFLPLGPVAASIATELAEIAVEQNTNLLFPSAVNTPIGQPGRRVADISAKIGGDPFGLLDIRRTCETMLAGLGISRDIRAQLLSHGISGVQAAHYDRHEYTKEKRAALVKWERHLKRIASGDEEIKVVSFDAEARGR